MRCHLLLLTLALGLPLADKADEGLQGPALVEARSTIRGLAKKLKGVERLHADFVQEQHTLLLDEPLISKGRLGLRARPGCLVLELKEPHHVILRSDETSHQVHYLAKKKAERYLFESNDLAKTLLSILIVDVAELEKAFSITGQGADGKGSFLELRLRDKKKRRVVDHLRILVAADGATLSGVSFLNSDGEKTVLRLSGMRYISANSTAQERARERDVFDQSLPKDVRLTLHTVPKGK